MSSHLKIQRGGTGRYTKVEFLGTHWKVWIKSNDFKTGWFVNLYPDGIQTLCYVENEEERILNVSKGEINLYDKYEKK